jgi:MOSC domain-containing protein YiiM
MGEQIVISGLASEQLAGGTCVRLGDMALIEVLKARTGCDRLRQIQGCTPDAVAGRLGVIARVVTGGIIRVGDAAAVVSG